MEPQGVTDVVEPQRVGELSIEQGKDMTPRRVGPGLLLGARGTAQLRNQVRRNVIAKLPQRRQLRDGWPGSVFRFIHPRRVARKRPSRQPFFQPLWDACGPKVN